MKMQPQLLRRLAGFDVMAHVLGSLGLRSQLVCRSQCASPWTIAVAASQLSHFHVVERGPVWLQIEQQSPVALAQGDLLFVARGQAYRLVDQADRKDGPVIEITDNDVPGQRILLRQGKRRANGALVCGSFSFDYAHGHPLLAMLPTFIHVRARTIRRDISLQATIRCLITEVSGMMPGSQTIVSRLTDMLFIHILREWSLAQACSPNWQRALNDPRIGPALALIHERPVKAWTVARLAKKVGYSRSPFTVRFKRVVGESPQGYITRVRLQRAAQMLKEGHDSLRAIALAAGYESESSFSKAFKRQFQKTPGHFRRLAPQGEGRGI
jgi:AraC-like DNA-binding protein